jgi:homoserine O-acetyltransferase
MVESQHIVTLPDPLELEGQAPLFDARVACQVWGELQPENAVLLLHGLSRSSHALDQVDSGPVPWAANGWARALFGPGAPLELKEGCLICPNLLASPFGSTQPAEGLPFVTVTDQARAIRGALKVLGIERVRAVIGFSLGGMVALRMATLFPEVVESVATVLGPATLPQASRQRLTDICQRLIADPELRPGEEQASRRALVRARVSSLHAVYPRDWLASNGDAFAMEKALTREAERFAEVFDPYCYLALCRCLAECDLLGTLQWFEPRALVVACSSDELATPSSMLDTYQALLASGASARYFEIQSESGHRAPYLEPQKLAAALGPFLAKEEVAPAPAA